MESSPTGTLTYLKESPSVSARVKVPMAKLGTWKHDTYGEVSFTQDDFHQVMTNYMNNSLGYKPYLTFGHLEEEPNSTDSQRKRGDIETIVQEGDVLYGLFNTPDYVADMVRRGEYQYSSGEFFRNLTDKQVGDKLGCAVSRVALTNSPFIPFEGVTVQALSQNHEGNMQTFLIELSQSGGAGVQSNNQPEALTNIQVETQSEPQLEKPPLQKELFSHEVKKIEPVPQEPSYGTLPQLAAGVILQATQKATNQHKEGDLMSDQPTAVIESTPIERVEEPKTITTEQQTTLVQTPTQPAPAPQPVTVTPQAPLPTPQPALQPTPQVAPQPVQPTIDVAELINQVRAAVEGQFQAERLQSQTLVNTLQAQVNSLQADLNRQKETAQVFSQTMAKAQEEAQQRQLLSQGMPPVIVPKYIALHNAMLTNQSTIKLSMGAEGEKDVSTLSLLHDVVSECLSMGGLPMTQMGSTVSEQGSNPGGLLGDLKDIINKNKQLANNK